MEYYCDLHSHSIFSDGTWTPEALIEEGERLGLLALSLTDHNTIGGLPRFLAAAESKRIFPVPGVEFSTDFRGTELHILALMLPAGAHGAVNSYVEQFLREKEESNRQLCRRLSRAGYAVSYDEILSAAAGRYVNRAHIAYALYQKGYFSSVQEPFGSVLKPGNGFYEPAKMPDAWDTVAFIRSIGAIPVLAHAFRSIGEAGLRDFLTGAVPRGLLAMETMCGSYDRETVERSRAIAAEYSLLPSGGSDFHGDKKPDIHLGSGRGELAVPVSYLAAMMDAAGMTVPERLRQLEELC